MQCRDEEIAFWREVFETCRLNEEGLTFGQFVREPWHWLARFGQESAPGSLKTGFRPLLPAQARVLLRLREQDETNRKRPRLAVVGGRRYQS